MGTFYRSRDHGWPLLRLLSHAASVCKVGHLSRPSPLRLRRYCALSKNLRYFFVLSHLQHQCNCAALKPYTRKSLPRCLITPKGNATGRRRGVLYDPILDPGRRRLVVGCTSAELLQVKRQATKYRSRARSRTFLFPRLFLLLLYNSSRIFFLISKESS